MAPRTSRTTRNSSTCAICGKSIQGKVASLKRHERYCRKRLSNPVKPRQKACLACIHAKSRCDLRKPSCGLCQQKDKSCTYLGGPHVDEEPSTPSSHSNGLSTHALEADTQRSSPTPSEAIALDPSVGLSSQPSPGLTHEAGATPRNKTQSSPWNGAITSDLLKPKKALASPNILVQKLASEILCSYSEKRTSDVPFIHRSRIPEVYVSDDPMSICQDIQRSFATRRTLSCFSVWDAIASEQERIYDKRTSFDKWHCLSSAQAATIYLLMLIAEGTPRQHPTLPITLLFTLGVLFLDLNRIHPNSITAEEENGSIPDWEDWIFAESRLRTAMTYFILAELFNVDFGLPCDRPTDYKIEELTLPASKALWEAETEIAWREEFEASGRPRTTIPYFPVTESRLQYADLINFNRIETQSNIRNRKGLVDRIRTWHRGMDDFGMLVSMCSIMVQ